jgi:cytidylate kinase
VIGMAPIDPHRPCAQLDSFRLVTITGPSGAGKSRFCRDMVEHLTKCLDVPAVGISLGYIFRALAILARLLSTTSGPHHRVEPYMLVAAARGLKIDGAPVLQPRLRLAQGNPVLDGHLLSKEQLKDPAIERYGSALGSVVEAYAFVMDLACQAAREMQDSGGLVVMEGRSLFVAFPDSFKIELWANDADSAHRSHRTIEEIQDRNHRDRSHPFGLPSGDTAVLIRPDIWFDTSGLSCPAVFARLAPRVLNHLDLPTTITCQHPLDSPLG